MHISFLFSVIFLIFLLLFRFSFSSGSRHIHMFRVILRIFIGMLIAGPNERSIYAE